MALGVLRADATCHGTILREGVAHAETYHRILVSGTLGEVGQILTDDHEGIAVVEVVAVDDTERLLDDILTHEHRMVRAPGLLTTLRH